MRESVRAEKGSAPVGEGSPPPGRGREGQGLGCERPHGPAIAPPSAPYPRRRRKRRRDQPVAGGIIPLAPGSGEGDEASVSGFGQFGGDMAFLLRGDDRG